MNTIKIIVLAICLSIVFSCNQTSQQDVKSIAQKTDVKEQEPIKKNEETENNITKKYSMLDGTWAESDTENAFFFISGDSLYYSEDVDNPVKISHVKDTLIIYGSVKTKCIIHKLTNDSLWFTDEYSDDMTKLIKVKE